MDNLPGNIIAVSPASLDPGAPRPELGRPSLQVARTVPGRYRRHYRQVPQRIFGYGHWPPGPTVEGEAVTAFLSGGCHNLPLIDIRKTTSVRRHAWNDRPILRHGVGVGIANGQ